MILMVVVVSKYLKYLIAFLSPIIIMLIVMAINNIYPFGSKILLMLDGYYQYPGFSAGLADIIKNHDSLLYSFKGMLGINFYAAANYYVFNPTFIFVLLFNKLNIVDFYTFIIILRMGLASLSMFLLANYLNKNNVKFNLIVSLSFGLMAYNLLYYFNYAWFDSIILAPIILLGIEKIFKENKYGLYITSLGLVIISNYYIGYMLCIFSLIFFIYKFILNNKKKKKLFLKFILASLGAVTLASFILIPSIIELTNGKSSLIKSYTSYYMFFDWDFLNVFYKLTIGSYLNGDLEYGKPNVYVSIFILLNSFIYFFNPNIKKKERIISFLVIGFLLLSMSFNFLDYFWHMMQMPIWYPVRYSFIFSLFLIYLTIKNYQNLPIFTNKKWYTIVLILAGLIILGSFTSGVWKDIINIYAKLIYLLISFIIVGYYLVFIMNKDLHKWLIFIFLFEIIINTGITLKNNANKITYDDLYTPLSNNLSAKKEIKDNSFYRMSFEEPAIKNNGLLIGYNSINYFSSVYNDKTVKILTNFFKIRSFGNCNIIYYYNNPIMNALFNMKYYISNKEISYYNLNKKNNNNYIYQNKDITNIAFLTNNKVLNIKYEELLNNNMNNLVSSITNNKKPIMKEINMNNKNTQCNNSMCILNGEDNTLINYEFDINKKGFIFIKKDSPWGPEKTKYEIIVNNIIISNDIFTPILLEKNDHVTINIHPQLEEFSHNKYYVYYLDHELYQNFIKNIQQEQAKIVNYKSDSNFTLEVEVKNNNILFTTIPSDKGWEVYVDGKKYNITKVLDGLIALDLEKGKHNIQFIYHVPGLKEGIIISSLMFICLIVFIVKERKK